MLKVCNFSSRSIRSILQVKLDRKKNSQILYTEHFFPRMETFLLFLLAVSGEIQDKAETRLDHCYNGDKLTILFICSLRLDVDKPQSIALNIRVTHSSA